MPLPSLPQAVRAMALVASLAAALWMAPAQAAPTTTKFEPTLDVQGVKLQLNGTGTRRRAIFKGYDLALYTTRKVHTPEELLALAGPKKLQFAALREISGTELGRLFVKALGENSPREAVQKHSLASLRLIEIFSGQPKLMPGDTFAMEFVPGKGTTFYILGKPQGVPVGDAEYFAMVLRIWVGTAPVDKQLKADLLDQPQD